MNVLLTNTVLDRLAHTVSSISANMRIHGRDLPKIKQCELSM